MCDIKCLLCQLEFIAIQRAGLKQYAPFLCKSRYITRDTLCGKTCAHREESGDVAIQFRDTLHDVGL